MDGVMKASVNTFGAFDNVVEGVLDTDLSAPMAQPRQLVAK